MNNPNRRFLAFASPAGSDEAMSFMADYARRLADQFHNVAVIDLSEYSYMEYRFPDVKMKPAEEGVSFCTPKTMSDLVYALKRASATRRDLNSDFLEYMMSRAYVSNVSEVKTRKGLFRKITEKETDKPHGYVDIIRDAANPLDIQELTYKEMIGVVKAAGDMRYEYILINVSRFIRDIKAMSQSGIEEMIDRLIVVSGENEIDKVRVRGLMSAMKCFSEFYGRLSNKLQIVTDINMIETLTAVAGAEETEKVTRVAGNEETEKVTRVAGNERSFYENVG